jgi:uncharacterized protein (DUF2336 family)
LKATVLNAGLINELEVALGSNSMERRERALRRVTDLFLAPLQSRYSDEQIDLFGDVMTRLSTEIEVTALVMLADRLASAPHAPRHLMQRLAANDSIAVAAPVLSKSSQLDDDNLAQIARTMSQQHLLAITRRRWIAEIVTTILIQRGDEDVALDTVLNPGSQFSEDGYSRILARTHTDSNLAVGMWLRADIPRRHLLTLFTNASEVVRMKLETATPGSASVLGKILNEIATEMHGFARAQSSEHKTARGRVEALYADGGLNEARLKEFAVAGEFNAATVALSLLCNLGIDTIERSVADGRAEVIVIFASAIELRWETVRAILNLRTRRNENSTDYLENALASFTRLKPETARKAINFFRLRDRTERTD